MAPVILYRLGQIRHAEILQQADRTRQHPLQIRPLSTAPLGRLLLAWGARYVGASGCTNVAARGYSITVCAAQGA